MIFHLLSLLSYHHVLVSLPRSLRDAGRVEKKLLIFTGLLADEHVCIW